MAAAKNGHKETVFELIELGADLGLQDADGLTAIEWAKKKGQALIVEGLEQVAAKPPQSVREERQQ
jgi:ankyrin repeat protein